MHLFHISLDDFHYLLLLLFDICLLLFAIFIKCHWNYDSSLAYPILDGTVLAITLTFLHTTLDAFV